MRSLAAGLSVALIGGGAAAQPTTDVLARLVTSVCMPMIQSGAFQPDNLPPGGRKLAPAEKARLNMAQDLGDWRYESDDDFVVVEIRPDNGCDVVTGATGGPQFLPALRRAVSDRYAKPERVHGPKFPEASPDESYITYWVDLPPGGPPGSPPAEALAITYSKAGAQTPKRTFYVGVIPATRKPN